MNKSKVSIFLDSGAPSLYNTLVRKDKGGKHSPMGSPLSQRIYDDFSFTEKPEYREYRRKYVQFIKKYIEYIDVYANLDVINNAELTWENQQYMEARGLHPIPVWHFGCKEHWLDMYVRKGYDYIAIGGIVPNPPKIIISGLDGVWNNILTNSDGVPIVKTHGFAITSPRLMLRYPWYSVDSTSWVKFGKYGIVLIPQPEKSIMNPEEDYCNPLMVVFSERSPSIKGRNRGERMEWGNEGVHISSFKGRLKEYIYEYIDKIGLKVGKSEFKKVDTNYILGENEKFISGKKGDPERDVEIIIESGLCNDYKVRDQGNILFYKQITDFISKRPWIFNPPVYYKNMLEFK